MSLFKRRASTLDTGGICQAHSSHNGRQRPLGRGRACPETWGTGKGQYSEEDGQECNDLGINTDSMRFQRTGTGGEEVVLLAASPRIPAECGNWQGRISG